MEKRRTKKEYFDMLIDVVERYLVDTDEVEEIVAFLNHEKELLNKKSNAKTKTQKENDVLVEVVYEALKEIGRAVTVSELMTESEKVAGLSNQRLTHLLKKLKNDNRVVRVEDKKKAYYSIAE